MPTFTVHIPFEADNEGDALVRGRILVARAYQNYKDVDKVAWDVSGAEDWATIIHREVLDTGTIRVRFTPLEGKIVLESQKSADLVAKSMLAIVQMYDAVSVSDLNELLGLPTTYIDSKWGWTEIPYNIFEKTEEGFVLDLSTAQPIV